MADDLFQQDPNEIPEIAEDAKVFDELVGEGKKYRDQETLARAAREKDLFIAQILREQKELRETLSKRDNEEEFLTKLESLTQRKSPDEGNQTPAERDTNTSALTPEAVEKILEARDTKKARETNLKNVLERLQDKLGDDYKRHVQKTAKDLGVGTDFLTSIAAENPTAFYKIMGLDDRKGDVFSPPPRSSVNIQSNATSDRPKTDADYQKLRKEKGDSWYFSAAVQQQRFNDAKKDPEGFGLVS